MPDDPPANDEKDKIIAELRREEAANRRKIRDLEAHNAQLTAQAADQDKVIAQAKADGAAEARAQLGRQNAETLLDALVKGAAKGRFHDVSDALAKIDKAKLIGADNSIDEAAIEPALTEILTASPHYAMTGTGNGNNPPAPTGTPPAPKGDGDGGPRFPAGGDSDVAMSNLIRQAVNRS